MIFLKRIRIIT